MSKFDLVLKIQAQDLIKELFNREFILPDILLRKQFKIPLGLKANYFNWGRNALYYLFKSLRFKSITFPAFTCPTLAEAAEKAGKKIVLTEINLATFNLDINKIPKDTKCLVVVHTFGNPVNISQIRNKFPKIFIIEDCAHALFAKINNQYVGNQGDAILFSLYKQTPNLNGSLLLAQDDQVQPRLKEKNFYYLKRLIYKIEGFHQLFLDFKRRQYLPVIESQLLNNKLPCDLVLALFSKGFKELEKEVEKRRQISAWYYQEAAKSKFIIPQNPESNSQPSYYHFVIRLDPQIAEARESLVKELRKKQIFVDRLWYQAPITLKKYRSFQKECSNALLLAKTVINFPIYSWYIKKDVKFLFKELEEIIIHFKSTKNGK